MLLRTQWIMWRSRTESLSMQLILFATKDELSVIFSNDHNKRTKASFDDADNVQAMHFCFISIGSVVLDVLLWAKVILYIFCSAFSARLCSSPRNFCFHVWEGLSAAKAHHSTFMRWICWTCASFKYLSKQICFMRWIQTYQLPSSHHVYYDFV